jgi:type IV pilus assembly protein PilW
MRKNLGLTLVELLVSMVIGLFLIGGVLSVMLDSKDQFLVEQEMAYIQENGRFAVDQMGYDIRLAGYFGCSVGGELTNTLNGSTDADGGSFSSNGIKGFEFSEKNDADFPSDIESLLAADTDVVVVNRGQQDDSLVVTSHVPASQTIHLSAPSNLNKGDILIISSSDCRNMAIFQMSGPNNTANPSQIGHNSGGSVSPGNCHKALSTASNGAYSCSSVPANNVHGRSYPPGSSLMQFISYAYFVGTSSITGLPTLYRMSLGRSGTSAVNVVEEFVSGVEDLQVVYGVDSSATADAQVDRYYSADDITADIASAGSTIAWDRVITARVTLIMRSNRQVFPVNTAVNLGDGFTFNDRFMRQRISSTIRIRNRGLGEG